MGAFGDTIDFVHQNPVIDNIGMHINLAEGKPVTNFKLTEYLDEWGNWNINKTQSTLNVLNSLARSSFLKEINAQVEKALDAKINISHIDSHLHLHTLPAFYNLFIEAAKNYKLKLRIAQTYREKSYLKFYYRRYINDQFKKANVNRSDFFETVDVFLKNKDQRPGKTVEIMVHPDFDASDKLFDHVDQISINNWISHLKS